ncbi:hypothetical protein MBANPS3_000384 [Mucor bainieri]
MRVRRRSSKRRRKTGRHRHYLQQGNITIRHAMSVLVEDVPDTQAQKRTKDCLRNGLDLMEPLLLSHPLKARLQLKAILSQHSRPASMMTVTLYAKPTKRNGAYPGISITCSSLVRNGVVYNQIGTKYPTRLSLLQYIYNNFADTDLIQAECTQEAVKKKIKEIAAKCVPPIPLNAIKLDDSQAKARMTKKMLDMVGSMLNTFQQRLKEGDLPTQQNLEEQEQAKKRRL